MELLKAKEMVVSAFKNQICINFKWLLKKKKKTDQAGQTDQSSWSQQLQQSDDYISSELQKPGMVIRT